MKLYTSKTCAYCKQVKEELDKNNLVYKEISIEDNETEWINVFELTGYPTVPTACHKESYFVPGRDFRSAPHLVEVLQRHQKSPFAESTRILEKIKSLTYNLHMAFGRTDQLLKQIESKLNTDNKDEKI